MLIERVIQLKKELDALRPISQAQEQRIMQKFRLDWNYHSNHLEGNTLTFGETKALILFGLTAQGKPFQDHIEMSGHDEAVKWIEEVVKQERPLNEAFIRELHTLILKEASEKKSQTTDGQIVTRRIEIGKYKTQPNHVLTKTGEMFYFATPEDTPAKMNNLMNWYGEERKKEETNPVLLATEFHYRFIRIHPFDDGNGRTARLLMNFILMSYGYPPVIIKTTDKTQYFNVLQLADAGNIEPFIQYIAENLVHSLEIMLKGAKGESIEDDNDLMKEIALLEVRLKNLGGRKRPLKTEGNLENLWQNSLSLFLDQFFNLMYSYESYYQKLDFTTYFFSPLVFTNSKLVEISLNYKKSKGKWLFSMKKGAEDEKVIDAPLPFREFSGLEIIPSISFWFKFIGFNYTIGEMPFNFKYHLDIELEDFVYKISIKTFDTQGKSVKEMILVEKLYDELLSSEEIKMLNKIFTDEHNQLILKKIEEKETQLNKK